jgi:hypothetical protein
MVIGNNIIDVVKEVVVLTGSYDGCGSLGSARWQGCVVAMSVFPLIKRLDPNHIETLDRAEELFPIAVKYGWQRAKRLNKFHIEKSETTFELLREYMN